MEIQEGRFETNSKVDEEMAEFCNGMSGGMKVSRIACSSGSGGSKNGRVPSMRREDLRSTYRSSRTTTRRATKRSSGVNYRWNSLTFCGHPPNLPFVPRIHISQARVRKAFSRAAATFLHAVISVNTTNRMSKETVGLHVPVGTVRVRLDHRRISRR